MSESFDLFSSGNFHEFIEKNISLAREMKYTNDPIKANRNVNLLYHLLAACLQCGYYCNYLEVLKKYNMFSPLNRTYLSTESLMVVLNFTLESLLYCLYNNESENLEIEYNIQEQIENTIHFQDEFMQKHVEFYSNQRQCELRELYDDYKNNRTPIYTVEYLYPFEPIVKDYIFDLSPCSPYISLEVKKVPRDNDNYTSFKFRVHGLIKPDTWWKGPKYETCEKMPPVRKSLDIANMLLLQAVKASPGKLVLPYSINQVCTVSMFQFRWDEKEHILGGTITSTDFTADWVGGNAQWHQFTDEEMSRLNQAIITTYGSKPFVTTFHLANNLLSAGFHLEAFSLLCFCCEGMIDHWLGKIANANGISAEYFAYKEAKISRCDDCKFFDGSSEEKPYDGMPPSLFSLVSYMFEKGCISKENSKTIKKLISTIRNDGLRNRTMHGNNYEVSKNVVERSLEGIMKLQDLFVEIANQENFQQ